jgi:hypothetical protein
MSISQRALVVVRKGRPRKPGHRHPCGQLIDPSKAEVTEAEKAFAKVIAIHQPHRRDVPESQRHDAKAGTVLGRLELGGKITREQFLAGEWYAGVVRRYRQVIMAPNCNPGSISGATIVGSGGPVHIEDEEAQRRKSVYDAAFELLDRIGQRVAKAVAHTAVHDRPAGDGLNLLLIGLEALAVHRGLTKPKNSCTEKQTEDFRARKP